MSTATELLTALAEYREARLRLLGLLGLLRFRFRTGIRWLSSQSGSSLH